MTVESFGGLSRYPRRGLGYSGLDIKLGSYEGR